MNRDEDGAFPLGKIPEIRARPGDFRLQRRVPFVRCRDGAALPLVLRRSDGPETPAVFVEAVTTGPGVYDSIVELAMARCGLAASGEGLAAVYSLYRGYEEPRRPAPPHLLRLAGIEPSFLAGAAFARKEVAAAAAGDPIMVSTGGARTRRFFERRFPSLAGLRWVDPVYDVSWQKLSPLLLPHAPLPVNLERLGYFFRYGSAVERALGCAWFFDRVPGAVRALAAAAGRETYRVWARSSRYEVKEELAFRGYAWNPRERCWFVAVRTREEAEAEREYLQGKCADPRLIEIEVIDRRRG